MKWLVAVSFGELILKGKNRKSFFNRAIKNIKRNIEEIGYNDIFIESSKVYIDVEKQKHEQIISQVKKVFGIIYISQVIMCEKNLDSIAKAAICAVEDFENFQGKTFKVKTNRVDKSFVMKSPEISAKIGGYLLKHFKNIKVDVHNPDFEVFVDIKEDAFVYIKRIEGYGGLPIGSSGRGLLLLSGGIDSPVAGFMMAKRGVEISVLHFHSYPFTSKRAHQKVNDLAKILSQYTGEITMYSVNLLNIYKEIAKNCRSRETTILSRRFMMKIGERICNKHKINVMITGESLGQVASQTIQSVSVINEAVDIPILRPLIGMDKTDIIKISREIGSYEKSIEPFDDCCSVFTPDRPVTKPRLKDIEYSENNLDTDKLIDDAIENMEIIKIV
ncbi:MAG: tRNA uracil 4-sulfurtransferase ThiI [Tissierellia bacterium]|nr:tRNA uracil 4-sulfurtransferase ThiI [Tissierellia bacterium]